MSNKHGFSLLYIAAVALLLCGCTEIPEHCGNYVLRDPVTKECMPSTDPNRPFFTVTVDAGDGAIGAGRYSEREVVDIFAGTPEDGQQFKYWTTSSSGVKFDDANNATTKFKMPAGNVTVTAVFEGTSGPVTPPPADSTAPPVTPAKYAVTVSSEGKDATGSGYYVAGDTVWISAGAASDGKQFKNWTTTSDGVTFTSANSPTTTFIMPANEVTVTAAFETQTIAPTTYAVTVISAGTGAKGADNYAVGAAVIISAGTAPNGQQFKEWTSNSGVVFVDANSETTMFSMPAKEVTVTANFVMEGSTPPLFKDGTFTDSRDKKSYKTTTIIGYQTWMAENLNYTTTDGGSWCYGNNNDNCAKYGRLYDFNTAMKVCPTGWHLPSRKEWGDLAKVAGGTGDYGEGGMAATKLKAKSGWYSGGNGTDDLGFSALPGGSFSSGSFDDGGSHGYWWTSTNFGATAWRRYMGYYYNYVGEQDDFVSRGFSVRCVQN